MTDFALTVAALLGALVAAGWAGLLALAEESAGTLRAARDGSGTDRAAIPFPLALQIARLVLLVFAGVFAAEAAGWWYRAPFEGLWIILVSTAFLFLLADALPRTIGALAPDLADAAIPLARRSLLPFRPLLGVMGVMERVAARLLPRGQATGASLGPAQRDMLLGIFALTDTTVSEVMTPRLDLQAIESRAGWADVKSF